MTMLPVSAASAKPMRLVLGAAAGRSHEDFFVLGYSQEYDRRESARQGQSAEATFVLRFAGGARHVVAILPQRLDDLWQSERGRTYAVGDPVGIVEVTAQRVTELSIDDLPGVLASIWGSDEDHVYACGHYRPVWIQRQLGTWSELALPADTGGLWRVCGHAADDVYAVTDRGEILHFDGSRVRRLDSPTTRWLVAIAPMPNRRMCVAGYDGVLFYGDVHGWRAIDSGTQAPLLNVVSYADGVCYIAPDGVFHFDGRTTPRRIAAQGGRWLSRAGERLLVVDDERSWLFDGQTLTPLDTTL